jgi:hypothetical protein
MGSNPISSAVEPLPIRKGLCYWTGSNGRRSDTVRRYFVRVEVEAEAEDRRLVTVELEGRLLDGTGRPPGVRVARASVVSIHELPDES